MRRTPFFLAAAALLSASLSLFGPTPTSWAAIQGNTASTAAFCMKAKASVEPHHAHVGDGMYAEGTWTNCGRSIYFTGRFVFTGPCGPIGSTRFHGRLNAHQGIGLVTTVFIACRGTYRLTTEAYHGGQLLDRMSRRVHVSPSG